MGPRGARLADLAVVTDDNPRTRNPAAIAPADPAGVSRSARRSATGRGDCLGDRRTCSRRRAADRRQRPRDRPNVGETVHPSTTRDRPAKALAGPRRDVCSGPPRMATAATRRSGPDRLERARGGIDSRTVEPGDSVHRPSAGPMTAMTMWPGARCRRGRCHGDRLPGRCRRTPRCCRGGHQAGLRPGQAAGPVSRQGDRADRLGRQDRTKEMLRRLLSPRADCGTRGNLNNHMARR